MTLPLDAIRQAAMAKRRQLAAQQKWAIAYAHAEPAEPLLVETPLPSGNYHIVQFVTDDRTTGLMLIDPENGRVGVITGIQKASESVYRFLRPHEVPAHVERYGRAPDDAQDVLREMRPKLPIEISAKNVRVRPALYWEPCDQSVTPFYPFYRVEHAGPSGTDEFVVRTDGEIYSTITTGGRGL